MTGREALYGAIALIERGWGRGTTWKTIGGRDHYCVMGAINQAVCGNAQGVPYCDPRQDTIDEAVALVSDKIRVHRERVIGDTPTGEIMSWNDMSGRRKRQVLKLMREAAWVDPDFMDDPIEPATKSDLTLVAV